MAIFSNYPILKPQGSGSGGSGGTQYFDNGSVTAPSISFANATDTGMYMEIVDTFPMLRFTVDGVNAGFIQYAPVVTNEGNGNTAIGYFAMWQADFTSVGAGLNMTNNAAFGGESSYSLVSGGQNSSFGSRSLWTNVSGDQNTALGQGALFYYTGDTNVAVGFHAGRHCTGGGCTFVGTSCGDGAAPTTATGQNNTAVGRLCMSIYTTATQCTVMGTSAIGTSGAGGVLGLSNSATAPTTAVDITQLYSVDLSAGNATLGIRTETAVAADAAVVSTHSLSIVVNGTTYRLLLAT